MGIEAIYNYFLFLWTFLAVIVFVTLFFKDAPYGRYLTDQSSLTIPSRIGWIIMESPAVIGIFIFFYFFYGNSGLVEILFCLIWLVHYIHRSFIWPFRARLKGKQMTISVMVMALLFNLVNVTLQGIWIFILGEYSDQWLLSPIFMFGVIVFATGMMINIKSDNILMELREKEGEGYYIPNGFFFKFVSSPNYLGEIIEWLGWALLTMSPAGLVFLIWTIANLVPRAKSNHEWSKSNISNYPSERNGASIPKGQKRSFSLPIEATLRRGNVHVYDP